MSAFAAEIARLQAAQTAAQTIRDALTGLPAELHDLVLTEAGIKVPAAATPAAPPAPAPAPAAPAFAGTPNEYGRHGRRRPAADQIEAYLRRPEVKSATVAEIARACGLGESTVWDVLARSTRSTKRFVKVTRAVVWKLNEPGPAAAEAAAPHYAAA